MNISWLQSATYWLSRTVVSKPIRSLANCLLPKRLVVLSLLPPLSRHRMLLDLRSPKAYLLGTYEPAVCETLMRLVRPGWTVADLGAHIGYFTLLLAKLVGRQGRVVAFEPNPANFHALQENVRANGYENVVLELKAVSNSCGLVSMYMRASSSEGSLVGEFGEPVPVQGITLDSYWRHLGNPALHLIKMDIEGAEDLAVEGMAEILERHRPIIIVEIHAPNDGKPSCSLDCLKRRAYQLYRLDRGGLSPAEVSARGHILGMP